MAGEQNDPRLANADDDPVPGTIRLDRVPMVPGEKPPAAEATVEMTAGGDLMPLPMDDKTPATRPVSARLLSGTTLSGQAPSTIGDETRPLGPGGMANPARTAAAPGVPATMPAPLAASVRPRLRVLRGLKVNVEYPLYDGPNFLGRRDDKPVDVDLQDQEPSDRVWASRQHAVVTFEDGVISIEDLNSLNGTFVNRNRVYPGQKRFLAPNDVIQIGTIQLKVLV